MNISSSGTASELTVCSLDLPNKKLLSGQRVPPASIFLDHPPEHMCHLQTADAAAGRGGIEPSLDFFRVFFEINIFIFIIVSRVV